MRKDVSSKKNPAFSPVWLFLGPSVIALLCTAGWPLWRTVFFSLTDAKLMALSQARWTGLSNYITLWNDPLWIQSLKNTFWFTGVSVVCETLLGLGIAWVLHKNFPGRGWVRAIVLIPWAIPTVISAKMWAWMYHDIYGIINELLLRASLISEPIAWLAQGETAMWAAIIADVWKTTPFMVLLLLAGLQMIPKEYEEAAKIDGVHPLKTYFFIILPLLRPALSVAILFRTLDALRIFDLIYILTSNGEETMTLSIYARQQVFAYQNVGVGSAASTCLFLLVGLFSIIFILCQRQKSQDFR